MAIRFIPVLMLIALTLFACKQTADDNGSDGQDLSHLDHLPTKTIDGETISPKDRVAGPGEIIKSSSGRDHTHKRGSALSILNYRIENDEEKFYSIIENGVWEYMFVHNGNRMIKTEELGRQYIDFKEDLTYEKGKAGKIVEQGKYHYSNTEDLILMIPDDKSANPQEWKPKFKAAFMILEGTSEYGNRNFQMKLERRKSTKEI